MLNFHYFRHFYSFRFYFTVVVLNFNFVFLHLKFLLTSRYLCLLQQLVMMMPHPQGLLEYRDRHQLAQLEGLSELWLPRASQKLLRWPLPLGLPPQGGLGWTRHLLPVLDRLVVYLIEAHYGHLVQLLPR